MSEFRVFAVSRGKRLTIFVKSYYMIERVRELIADSDASVHDEPIMYKGRVLLEDETMSSYNITEDETISVISWGPFDTRVFVKSLNDDATNFSIDVNEFNNIGLVKQLVYEKLDTGGSENLNEISLIFDGKQLDDTKILFDYHIRSGDTLNFIYKLECGKNVMCVSLKTLSNVIYQMYVDTTCTKEYLNTLVFWRQGTPCDNQRLIYLGRQLEEGRQLSYYGVDKKCTIHLVYRLRGGGYAINAFLFSNTHAPFHIREQLATDPSHRRFCNGVSSVGVCVNPKCVVYGEKFICQHGYGLYRVHQDPTRCPECQDTSPRVETFGFSRANVTIRTMPLGLKTQQVEIRSDLSEAKGNYAHLPYLLLSNTNRQYEFIEVFSCALDCSITLSEKLCSLCCRTLDGSDDCDHGLVNLVSVTL